MNQQALLRKLKKMQDEMMQTQKEIEETVFKASSGGIVSVEVYGSKTLKSVTIDDDFTADGKEDLEMLGDAVVAAVNKAYAEVDKTTETKMAKFAALTGGMGGFF